MTEIDLHAITRRLEIIKAEIEAWKEVRPGRIRCRLFLDEPRVLPGQETLLEVPDA